MSKVVLQQFVSIDGLVARLNDRVDVIAASTAGGSELWQEQVALMDTT